MKPKIILKTVVTILILVSVIFGITIYLTFKDYRSLVSIGEKVDQIKTDIFQRRLIADDYLIYKNERAREQWQIEQSEIVELLKGGISSLSDKDSQDILSQMNNAVVKSQQIFDQIIDLIENKKDISPENLSRLTTQLTSKAQETISLARELSREITLIKGDALNKLVILFSILMSIYLLFLLISFVVIWESVGLLEKVDQMKSDFVSLVSHQLKTPVAQVKGYVSNMIDGLTGPINDKQKEYLSDMLNVANKNSQLIDDLLNVSRIERGMLKVTIENLSMATLLKDVVSPLTNVASAKGVVLKTEGLQIDATIKGDPVKTKEAIRNIVDNAIKFTDSGKSVTVKAQDQGNSIQVSVTDEGPGIDPDVQKELFEKNRVWTGKVKAAGAGLGLYLSKQFIELTGGIIKFSTKQGVGTTFVINLPKA